MKNFFILLIASALLLSCGDGSTKKMSDKPKSAEKVLLRLKYDKGAKMILSFDMDTSAEQGVSVMEQIGLELAVVDITAGDNPVYKFDGQVAYMKMDSRMMGQHDHYDSSKKVENMTSGELEWHREFEGLIRKPLSFSLDSQGQIVKSFEYSEAVYGAMDQPVELNNYQIQFPEKEVGIDDTWKSEYKNPLTGGTVKNTYTLADITAETVVVKVESLIPGVKGVMGENTMKGEYTLDRKTGMLKEGVMEGNMNQMNAKIKYTFTTTIIQ